MKDIIVSLYILAIEKLLNEILQMVFKVWLIDVHRVLVCWGIRVRIQDVISMGNIEVGTIRTYILTIG